VGVGVGRAGKITAPSLSAVFGVLHRHTADPQALIVVRVDADLAEIHWPRIAVDVSDACPCLAFVI
jgi:hypothetical protein